MLDTEDLDGDQLLNAAGVREDVFRYVVDLARGDFYVRDGVTTLDRDGRPATWRLYRIPLREPTDTIGIAHDAAGEASANHLRGPGRRRQRDVIARFALARMRFLGSPWARRADTPILGLSGSSGEAHGEVSARSLHREPDRPGYESPPGIGDEVVPPRR